MGRNGSGEEYSLLEDLSRTGKPMDEVEGGEERFSLLRLLPLLSSESSEGMEGERGGGEVQQGC